MASDARRSSDSRFPTERSAYRMIRLALFAIRRPSLILSITLGMTLLLAAGGLRLELRTDGAALRPQGDPVIEAGARDRARFRDPPTLLLVVDATGDSLVASPAGFRFLRNLHSELRRVEVLRADEILSLAGLPRITRNAGQLSIDRQLERIQEDAAGFEALLAEVRDRRLTDGLLLAPDGRRALLELPLRQDVDVGEGVRRLEAFAAEAATAEFELLLGGPLVAETTLGEKVLLDLTVLVPLMLAAIAILLAAMVRSPGGVLVPLVETLVVLIWTFGAMGWLGAPIALVTTILPVVLMALCITDELHLLERLAAHRHVAGMGPRLAAALRDVGAPIVATSLTTALGFLSFTSASIGPLREFGVFAAFGILVAMLLTFSFIPALIVWLPERLFATGGGSAEGGLAAYGRFAARRPGLCFAIGAAALAVCLPGLRDLEVGDSWVENFDPASDLVRAERMINESFWGSYRFDVVFEGEPGAFHEPAGAALMEEFRAVAVAAPHVGGVETYLAPLEEIAAGLGVAGPLSALPLVELWDLITLAEMAPVGAGLTPTLSEGGGAARGRLYVKSADYRTARALSEHLDRVLPPLAERHRVGYHVSGDLPEASALVESIVVNQLRSIGWALVTVAVMLLLLARRPLALWALAPVAATTAGLLGAMGWAGVELGIATSMFSALTVGVGVDFGIHFTHRFVRERTVGKTSAAAVEATVNATGKALFWNAATLAAGFLVLTASSLKPNHSLGLLLAAATLACWVGSFLLLPLLLRGGRPPAAAFVAAFCLVLAFASPTRAEEPRCDGSADPAATELMQRIEDRVRGIPRILRMHIETHYSADSEIAKIAPEDPEPKTIWAVVGGDAEVNHQLFVFSGPGRMAGTSLLLRDYAEPTRGDGVWLYLRAFERFRQLTPDAVKTVVPGTAFTYEDARGFIANDRHHFRSLSECAAGRCRILGCPRSALISDHLGYDSIALEVDAAALLVRRIDYRGPGSRPLKRYSVVAEQGLAGQAFPSHVRLEQSGSGAVNDIRIEYWRPKSLPEPGLFAPDVREEAFLNRLQRYLRANELGDRIDAEVAAADARVRAWEERWGNQIE